MNELLFYVGEARAINKKFKGMHIALVDNEVVASGKDPKSVWDEAVKKAHGKKPVLAFVPPEETLVLFID